MNTLPTVPDQQDERISVGIWVEWHPGAQWINQGMTRLIGFLVEGNAISREYVFRITVRNSIRGEAQADLSEFNAIYGDDYTVHSPADVGISDDDNVILAEFANNNVPVEGWISLFPNYECIDLLSAPVSVIFPDAIPLIYPDFSEGAWMKDGHHVRWRSNVDQRLRSFDRIITFSRHVAENHVKALFDVADDRIHVIPHAPPSLEGVLPFIKGRERTQESRTRAADLLRQHCAQRGWDYLIDFPFEEARYIAISTQDRVTKNIRIAADAVERLVRRDRVDFKLMMTASLHLDVRWMPLPETIERSQLQREVLSMNDLPRDVHAAFYHCAELAVHPSIFEGGLGVFPYYEAVSVGTPCIMAAGPHVTEFVNEVPEMARYVFDPNDADALAAMILNVSSNRGEVMDIQKRVFERLRKKHWGEVAAAYGRAATSRGNQSTAQVLAYNSI
jgi:glycosyltransferase involved in cell wall biosynthesis